MTRWHEQGSGALLMVMLLAAVGLLLATGTQRQLDAAARAGQDERHYLLALNQAESSLNWGLGQTWVMDEETPGQCLTPPMDSLQACLLRVPGETYWLLRGEGRSTSRNVRMMLYRRVLPEQAQQTRGKITPVSGGWLDLCPEKEEARCAGP